MSHVHHEPRRALTPDEAEDRPECKCGCGLAIGHVDEQGRVWGPDAGGECYRLIEPGSRWTDGTFFEQSLLDAAGLSFRREACCLQRYRIFTVGEFAELVRQNAPILGRLNMTTDEPSVKTKARKRKMFVQRARLQELCLRLQEAEREFRDWQRGVTGKEQ